MQGTIASDDTGKYTQITRQSQRYLSKRHRRKRPDKEKPEVILEEGCMESDPHRRVITQEYQTGYTQNEPHSQMHKGYMMEKPDTRQSHAGRLMHLPHPSSGRLRTDFRQYASLRQPLVIARPLLIHVHLHEYTSDAHDVNTNPYQSRQSEQGHRTINKHILA